MTFLGVCIFAIGVPALSLLSGKSSFDLTFLKEHSTVLIIIFTIFTSFSWILIHCKFFWVPARVLETTLVQLAKKLAKREFKEEDNVEELVVVPSFKDRIMRNMYWISSIVVGSTYLSIEMYLLSRMLGAIKQEDSAEFLTVAFFVIAVPLFLLIGIPTALAQIRARNKALLLPLIVMLPMFGIVPLSSIAIKYSENNKMAFFFIVGPPALIFFWLGMSFLGLKKRRVFYLIFTFSCLFLFLPFVFFGLDDSTFSQDTHDAFFLLFWIFIGYLMVL